MFLKKKKKAVSVLSVLFKDRYLSNHLCVGFGRYGVRLMLGVWGCLLLFQ